MRLSSGLAVGSPTVRISVLMAATVLLALMVAAVGFAGSRLLAADGAIVVDPSGGGHFTTITEAVGVAVDGDTILIRPGIYAEEITLDKAITVRGDGDRGEIIVEVSRPLPDRASGFEPDLPAAFRFEESEAVVEHLTVRGDSSLIIVSGGSPILRDLTLDGIGLDYGMDAAPGMESVPSGIDILGGSMVTIEDSTFLGANISITDASTPTISGNEFKGNESGSADIWMEGGGVDPEIVRNTFDGNLNGHITIWGGARPTVQDNRFSGTVTAVEIQDSGWWTSDRGTDPVVRGNSISGATIGIDVKQGASATIEDNELTGNQTGLSVRGSDAVLTGNVIREGRTGVNLTGGGSPVLEENIIEGYEFGLMIGSGTTPTLTGNTICDNGQNLLLSGTAEMPAIEGNEICEVESAAEKSTAAALPAAATVTAVTEVDERTRDLVIESPSVGTRTVRLILPASWDKEPDATWPVLYLLHGQGGDHTDWTVDTDIVAKISEELDVLMVMPDGEAGYYSDWWNAGLGGQPMWATFHIEELPAILEADWRASQRRAVAGISMGGFGAMSYAARYPGFFGAAASFSGILDPLGSEWFHDPDLWGDKVEQADIWAAHDPVSLAPALADTALYVWAGDGTEEAGGDVVDGFESWLLEHHETFTGRLVELGIEATTEAGPGVHDWVSWDPAFERALPLLRAAIEE